MDLGEMIERSKQELR